MGFLRHNSIVNSERCKLPGTINTRFLKDVFSMRFYGMFRQEESVCDVGTGFAGNNQTDNFKFTLTQVVDRMFIWSFEIANSVE